MKKTLMYIFVGMIVAISIYIKLTGVHNPFSPQIKYVNGKPYEVLKHDIDTQYVPKWKTVYKDGKDIIHDTTIYVPIPINIDTLAIVKNYFAKNAFKDTLKLDDSLGFVVVMDTVSQNKIAARTYTAKVNKVTIKETTIVKELPKANIFLGAGAGFDKVNFINHIKVDLMLKTKCDKIYSIGAGVDINKIPFIDASIYWKLK